MREAKFNKFFLLGLCVIVLALSLYVIGPYITALLGAGVLAYMFHPLYEYFVSKFKNKFVSSVLVCVLVTVLILIPFAYLAHILISEAIAFYSSGAATHLTDVVQNFLGANPQFSQYVEEGLTTAVVAVGNYASKFVLSLPGLILQFLITIYTLFFLLIQGKSIVRRLERDLPLENKKAVFKHIADRIYGVTYGFFTVAIIELLFSALVFWALGIRTPLLWAVAIGFLALLPLVGPAIVWVPLAIVYFFYGQMYQVVGIVIMGVLISAILDGIVRQKIIGDRAKIHPVVALLGILGGLQLMGVVGIIIGPIILSVAVVLIDSFYKKYVKR